MRVKRARTRDEIAKLREQRYLVGWPPAQQLEALHDAAAGRPAKLEAMNADFDAIKAALPYPV